MFLDSIFTTNRTMISKMFKPTTKARHSFMDAGIKSQGCEAISGTSPKYYRRDIGSYHLWHRDNCIHVGITVLTEVPC